MGNERVKTKTGSAGALKERKQDKEPQAAGRPELELEGHPPPSPQDERDTTPLWPGSQVLRQL